MENTCNTEKRKNNMKNELEKFGQHQQSLPSQNHISTFKWLSKIKDLVNEYIV